MTRAWAAGEDLVVAALKSPAAWQGWDAESLSRLLRQARAAGLLGRVVAPLPAVQSAGGATDAALNGHAEAARRVTRAQQVEIRREVGFLEQVLVPLGLPVVLLKGAAYVMAGLPAAQGRVFSDVDILVPKASLAKVESALMLAGWLTTHHDAYDQRYYRDWMHELPPMEHVHRHTALDVHHTILPETARLHPDAQALLADAVGVPGAPNLKVLCPADMVLHSMTHLFLNEEMSHGLRDLSDIDLLLRHFGVDPGFWPALSARAHLHGLERPLYYGLRHVARLLGTPVPASASAEVRRAAPPQPLATLMDALWSRVLRSPHPSAAIRGSGLASAALYLRGHWLRMPPLLLTRHLAIKAWRRLSSKPDAVPG